MRPGRSTTTPRGGSVNSPPALLGFLSLALVATAGVAGMAAASRRTRARALAEASASTSTATTTDAPALSNDFRFLAVDTVPVWEDADGITYGLGYRPDHPPVVGWAAVLTVLIDGGEHQLLVNLDALPDDTLEP